MVQYIGFHLGPKIITHLAAYQFQSGEAPRFECLPPILKHQFQIYKAACFEIAHDFLLLGMNYINGSFTSMYTKIFLYIYTHVYVYLHADVQTTNLFWIMWL